MSIYIRSAASVSAQNTLNSTQFLTEPIDYTGTRLPVINPDYKQYIDPRQIRRMSHVIKMGIAAAQQCLNNAQVQMPGAIVTGTALGCIEDTYVFLNRIIEMEEEMLPPTAFIQSTHNTVGAQVALVLKCHAYNNTFVHKGVSFENALLDATLLLNEAEADNILVGGIDEMTDESHTVLKRLGLFRRGTVNSLDLYKTPATGTIGGEGASFVLLTDKSSSENMARLRGLKTVFRPSLSVDDMICEFLGEEGLSEQEVDIVITGRNGDIGNDAIYESVPGIFKESTIVNYKHLTGEYATVSAFALWLGANIIKRGEVPAVTVQQAGKLNTQPKNVLIYNHYQNIYHSLLLLSAC